MTENQTNIKGLEDARSKFAFDCAKKAKNGSQKHLEHKFIKREDSENQKQAKKLEISKYISDRTTGNIIEAQKLKEAIEKFGKEYKSYAKKLPMMIKGNGLGATLAFAFSKGKDGNAWELLYNDIQLWLQQDHKKFLLGNHAQTELVHAVVQLDSSEYRAVAVEVLAFLNWLRRFAEGLIEGEADND